MPSSTLFAHILRSYLFNIHSPRVYEARVTSPPTTCLNLRETINKTLRIGLPGMCAMEILQRFPDIGLMNLLLRNIYVKSWIYVIFDIFTILFL